MSRAFVNEDAPSGDVYIPPRAPLPAGAVNFVTARGQRLLLDELKELESERERLKKGDPHSEDRNRALTVVRGRIKDLESRIKSAKVVRAADQPAEEVRFGARVTTKTMKGRQPGLVRTFQLVQPFAGLTVRENIAVGAHARLRSRKSALAHADEVADHTSAAILAFAGLVEDVDDGVIEEEVLEEEVIEEIIEEDYSTGGNLGVMIEEEEVEEEDDVKSV